MVGEFGFEGNLDVLVCNYERSLVIRVVKPTPKPYRD